jgi:hypothetical protein
MAFIAPLVLHSLLLLHLFLQALMGMGVTNPKVDGGFYIP